MAGIHYRLGSVFFIVLGKYHLIRARQIWFHLSVSRDMPSKGQRGIGWTGEGYDTRAEISDQVAVLKLP